MQTLPFRQTLSFRQVGAVIVTLALALAIISYPYTVRSQRFANLTDTASPMAEALATVVPAKAASLIDPAIDQAFGFLVYDWDPRAQGGVPGFDRWITSAAPLEVE